MINAHFKKVAALTLGSLLTFSSSTFASTSNVKVINHATRLGNSELLTATLPPLKDNMAFARSIALAKSALGPAQAAASSAAIAGPKKQALAESIAKATTLIGSAVATSDSTATSDIKATALSLSKAETTLGDALAIANSDAISGPGKPAIAKSLASAETAVGAAAAVALSSAS
ncbi:hypothetical protein [uncultured Nostoc sp.]|uniref:hypothetical protein n=1 Tax=uncultured Nostoc sp. TaxID=340711 RepID=UPI0035CA6AD1